MKSIFLTVFLIGLVSVASAQTGILAGTIAFVTDDGRTFIKGIPKSSITFTAKNGKKVIVSDEEGDYLPTLPVGKYCLFSVESENGAKLKLQSDQHKCFKVYRNKTTRFDISILEQIP